MSNRNGFVVEITGNDSDERDLIVTGEGVEEVWQVAAKVVDVNGDQITPTSGVLRMSVKPRGGAEFLQASDDLDLTKGDFYRPFNIKAEAVRYEVFNLVPTTSVTVITSLSLSVVQ